MVGLRFLIVGFAFLVFFKIYQHNLIIKLNYEKQRIETTKRALENERNDLYAQLLGMQNGEQVLARAELEWGMKPIKFSRIITTTQQISGDFFSSPDLKPELKKETHVCT